jgi:hypothetical protein
MKTLAVFRPVTYLLKKLLQTIPGCGIKKYEQNFYQLQSQE